MIIGRALGRLIDANPIVIENRTCKYNYGNQDALDKFIAESDRKEESKYPLIFYVTKSVMDLNGWKYCDTDIILMVNTKEEYLYKRRTDLTYVTYIEPMYQQLRTIIDQNPFVTLLGDKKSKFSYTDVPNFGMTRSNVGEKKSSKSVVTDYVDARIIKVNLKIKTNCITDGN